MASLQGGWGEEGRGEMGGEEVVRGASWADHGTASCRVYCNHIPFTAAVAVEEEETRRRTGDWGRSGNPRGEPGTRRRSGTGRRIGDQDEKWGPGSEVGTRKRSRNQEENRGPGGEVGTWFLTQQ